MLNMLRNDLRAENEEETLLEAISASVADSDIRDALLDDMGELDVEMDDELAALVANLPEYDEEKEMNKKLKKLTESFIPNTEF